MKPVLFTIGGIEFYSYGLMVGIGYVLGVTVASNMARKKGVDPDSLFELFIMLLLAGVAGGRLLYVALNTRDYHTWQSVFDVRDGGFSIHGVLISGMIALGSYCRFKKLRFGLLFDIMAPGVALGQSIGRIGCLLSGCCYGILTNGQWGVLTRFAPGLRHPYPIYESIANFILFAILLKLFDSIAFEGGLFLIYISGYAVIRFFLEFFRESGAFMFGLSQAQWVSIALLGTSLVIYVYGNRKRRKRTVENFD